MVILSINKIITYLFILLVSRSEGEVNGVQGKVEVSDRRQSSTPTTREEDQEKQQFPGKQLDNPPAPQYEPKELTQLVCLLSSLTLCFITDNIQRITQ